MLRNNRWECYRVRASRLALTEAELAAQFPMAQISVTNTSSCDEAAIHSTPCCDLMRSSSEAQYHMRQPGVAVQQLAVARCVHALLDEHPNLDIVVRTRPDLVYLDPLRLVESVRAAVKDQALMGRKTDMVVRREPSDMFIAVVATAARQFFDSFSEPVQGSCAHGDPTRAWNPMPEGSWHTEYGYFAGGFAHPASGRPQLKLTQRLLPVSKVSVGGQVLCVHLKTQWWRQCCEALGVWVRNGTHPIDAHGRDELCSTWEPKGWSSRSKPASV